LLSVATSIDVYIKLGLYSHMEEFERPYRQVSRLKALAFFMFRPRAFMEMAARHDVAWVLSDSQDLREKYLRGEYAPNVDEHYANAQHRSSGLRRSLFRAAGVVFGSVVVGVLAGVVLHRLFGTLNNSWGSILQALGAAILLWATLWQLSRDLQSFGGNSLPERVHTWVFSSLYTLGTVLFFVVYGWQA